MTPAGTSNELDVQKGWEENTHTQVDEEQWKITQGCQRQAQWVWSPRTMSGLRLPDTPHATSNTTIHAFRPENNVGAHSFWTSSSLDVPVGVTQEEGHTGFLIHLLSAVHAFIFLARRVQPFLSLVDREVEFCVIVLHPLGILFLFFIFLVRKIPFAGIELTSQRVRRIHGYL